MIGIPLLLRQTDVKEIQVASSESAKQKVISAFSPQKDSVLLADKILPQAPEEDILQVKPEVHESAVLAELEGKILSHQASLRNTENPLKENMGDIVMKSDDIALNELVVTGHGTQRKRTITGVATLSKEIHPTFGETEFKQYFEALLSAKPFFRQQKLGLISRYGIQPFSLLLF